MRLHLRIGFRRSEHATFCDENVLLDHSALDPPMRRASLQTGLKPLDEKPGDTPCQSRPTRNLASLRLAEGPDCDVRRGACGNFVSAALVPARRRGVILYLLAFISVARDQMGSPAPAASSRCAGARSVLPDRVILSIYCSSVFKVNSNIESAIIR